MGIIKQLCILSSAMYFKVISLWEAHGNHSSAEQTASLVSIIAVIMPGVLHSLEECLIKSAVNQHPQVHTPSLKA